MATTGNERLVYFKNMDAITYNVYLNDIERNHAPVTDDLSQTLPRTAVTYQ